MSLITELPFLKKVFYYHTDIIIKISLYVCLSCSIYIIGNYQQNLINVLIYPPQPWSKNFHRPK